MDQEEKLKTAAIAMRSDFKLQTVGGSEQTTKTVEDMEKVKAIVNNWNDMPKKATNLTIEQYGPPNEATESRFGITMVLGNEQSSIAMNFHTIFLNHIPTVLRIILTIPSHLKSLVSLQNLMEA